MSDHAHLTQLLKEVQHHLNRELIPFWLTHGVDEKYGGFLTYFDENGNPTGETVKTLICQTRMIFMASHAHRNGFGDGRFLEIAKQGVNFLFKYFWDDEYPGWYWTCEQDGRPRNPSKLVYGHSFAIYALSEYTMAGGDGRGLEMAEETHRVLQHFAADPERGGFREFFERDWSPKKPGVYGGDRKSFDVHMHLMEAYTNLYEASGTVRYAEITEELIQLILDKILHPVHRTGIAQFTLDWQPLRAIIFKDVWGSDRDADDPEGRPLDNTSYGHNIEFAWLFRHALKMLGKDETAYADTFRKIFDHTADYGVDWERGGLYCEGPHAGPARERNKEFWQQAEALVGFLDAYDMFREKRYLDAYTNIHRFVMDHVINHRVGEWYPLLDENNNILWRYMGHAWKISYHTVRSMIQTEKRLSRLLARS